MGWPQLPGGQLKTAMWSLIALLAWTLRLEQQQAGSIVSTERPSVSALVGLPMSEDGSEDIRNLGGGGAARMQTDLGCASVSTCRIVLLLLFIAID